MALKRGKRGAGQRRVAVPRQPYGWLGVGALTLGVGAALAGGSGIAHAQGPGSGPEGDSSASAAAGPAAKRGSSAQGSATRAHPGAASIERARLGAPRRPGLAPQRLALDSSFSARQAGNSSVPAPSSATRVAAMASPVSGSQVAAAAHGIDPITSFFHALAALFNNQTPTLAPHQVGQDGAGVVTGGLGALDPDSSRLTYTVTQDPVHGTVEIDPENGTYAYTPFAAYADSGTTDSFGVTVSDEASGFAIHGLTGLIHLLTFGLVGSSGSRSVETMVNVSVAPINHAPTIAATATANSDGTTTISITTGDTDGDSVTTTATVAAGRGILMSTGGGYTFIPDAAYAHSLSAGGATAPASVAVTVTALDGRGGTVPTSVSVTVIPTDAAPTDIIATSGTPDTITGVVTGALSATDPDGDTLTYTVTKGPVVTGGSVSIGADGGFVYTPSDAARHYAATTFGKDADTFTVTISDGHGESTQTTVTVTVADLVDTANLAPVLDSLTVNPPDIFTGIVVGRVVATDPEGNFVHFRGSTTTPLGTLVVDPGGAFTFTPTAWARQYAADSPTFTGALFDITADDGHGGALTIPVTAIIAAALTQGSSGGGSGSTGAPIAVNTLSEVLGRSGISRLLPRYINNENTPADPSPNGSYDVGVLAGWPVGHSYDPRGLSYLHLVNVIGTDLATHPFPDNVYNCSATHCDPQVFDQATPYSTVWYTIGDDRNPFIDDDYLNSLVPGSKLYELTIARPPGNQFSSEKYVIGYRNVNDDPLITYTEEWPSWDNWSISQEFVAIRPDAAPKDLFLGATKDIGGVQALQAVEARTPIFTSGSGSGDPADPGLGDPTGSAQLDYELANAENIREFDVAMARNAAAANYGVTNAAHWMTYVSAPEATTAGFVFKSVTVSGDAILNNKVQTISDIPNFDAEYASGELQDQYPAVTLLVDGPPKKSK